MESREKIREFIESNHDVFEDEAHFSDSDNIFELGIVNSLFTVRIIKFVQEEFDIEMLDEDMEIDNFNSVDNILNFIRYKRESAG